MSNSDDPNMWKVIEGLKSTPNANSPNKAMSHNSRTITDHKSKSNIFINHYARVSKLNMSPCNYEINRQFKKCLYAPSVDDESCALILIGKLQSSIKRMKGKGPAGPNNIPPSYLKALGPLAHQLIIFTCSLPTNLEGCHYHTTTQSWEIS